MREGGGGVSKYMVGWGAGGRGGRVEGIYIVGGSSFWGL